MPGTNDAAETRTAVGRRILAALLLVTAVLHALAAVRLWPSVPAVLAAVLTVAAIGAGFVIAVRHRQRDLLAAIVVGAVGVAVALVPALFALGSGDTATTVVDAWLIGGLLVDTSTARLAALMLRREAQPRARGNG